MAVGGYFFGPFELDPAERQLRRDGEPVELNSRYLDVLTLLVREQGRLVTKDRFLDEVWAGTPVTDEALTQCIKTLRQRLGDDASAPRFIETVPKHGYRFIAEVEAGRDTQPTPRSRRDWNDVFRIGAAGTIGGGWAGLIGGLVYGFAGASQPLAPGMGAVSVLLVLTSLTILVALIGGAGVSFGIAASGLVNSRAWLWSVIGGGLGGMLIGGGVKLLGLDAFNLLLGRSPGDITGAGEGLAIGAAVGLAAWLATRCSLRRGVVQAGVLGAVAGTTIILVGGRLMAGSIALLAEQFPDSRLRLEEVGPTVHLISGALEGGLFAACVVGAMTLAKRS